jgi:hypothetical protein
MTDNFVTKSLPFVAMPIICVFGMVTNGLNAAVFMHPRMKDASFKYLLFMSLTEMVYLGMNVMLFVTYCDECHITRTYATQVYLLISREFLSRSFIMFNILCNIFLSLQRYMILKNRAYMKSTSHIYLISFLFVFSLIYYLPVFSLRRISLIQNDSNNNVTTSDEYRLENNEFGSSLEGKLVLTLLQSFRFFIGSLVLGFFNFLNIYELKKRFSRNAFNFVSTGTFRFIHIYSFSFVYVDKHIFSLTTKTTKRNV